jgi:hypothetical protein
MSRITNQERLLMLGRNGKLKSTKELTIHNKRIEVLFSFFAIETSGGLGEFVKLFAKMSGGNISSTILQIYQTLAVEFQTA